MSHIKKLYEFIYNHAGNNTHVPSEENINTMLSNIEDVVRGFFKGRKPAVSPSQFAQPARKLAMLHSGIKGDNKDTFKPTSRLKMGYASIIEHFVTFLMAEAGVSISDQQRRIKIKIEDDAGNVIYEMKGSNDYTIDGVIRDFKCTDSDQYKTKWKSFSTLKDNDVFAYHPQGTLYDLGAQQEGWSKAPFGGWDVCNLSTGEIKEINTKGEPANLDDIKGKLEALQEHHWDEFPYCYEPWRDTKGRLKLDWRCSRCEYVGVCWPTAKKEKNNINHVAHILEE